MSSRVASLRKLGSQYWQPTIALLAGVYGVLNFLGSFWAVPLVPASPAARWAGVVSAALVLLLTRHPRLAYWVARRVFPVDEVPTDRRGFRGFLPYTAGEELPGRAHDVEQCRVLIQRARFMVLDGETGCGKSSILAAALLPEARKSIDTIELTVGDDPFRALYHALSPGATPPGRIGRAQILARLDARNASEGVRPLLIVIDQFEELFVLVGEGVRRRFAVTLREVVESSAARVVVALRSDFLDLLMKLCREVDPELRTLNLLSGWYTLKAFRESTAREVVEAILGDVPADDVLLEHEIHSLATSLAHDLLRPPRDSRLSSQDPPTVLPVELQVVGYMLQVAGKGRLTAERFRDLGGRAGLMRAFVEQTKDFVRLSAGVDGEVTLLVLREFVSSAGTRQPRSMQELKSARLLASIPDAQLTAVLRALETRYLVKKVAEGTGGEAGELRYALVHEYLARILSEAPDPLLQKARDAEERLQFWLARDLPVRQTNQNRFARMFHQPIPVVESLRLRRYAPSNEALGVLNRNLKGFASRVGAVLLLLLVAASGGWAWWNMEAHQAELAFRDGMEAMPRLANASEPMGALLSWMVTLGELGRTDEAIRAWERMRDLDLDGAMLRDAADTLLSRNAVAGAAGLVHAHLEHGFIGVEVIDSASVIVRTTEALARSGKARTAIELAKVVPAPAGRACALAAVGLGLSRSGQTTLAREALRQARFAARSDTSNVDRLVALDAIGHAAVEIADHAEARAAVADLSAAVQRVRDPTDRVWALGRLSALSSRTSDLPRAREAAAEAIATSALRPADNQTVEDVFASAASELARQGQTAWLMQQLRAMSENARAPAIRESAAKGLAEAGQVDSALALARVLGGTRGAARVRVAVAHALLQERASLPRAKAMIEDISSTAGDSVGGIGNLRLALIQALLSAGQRGTAMEVAGQMKMIGSGIRSNYEVLLGIATAYATAGLTDSATAVARMSADTRTSCIALAGLAEVLIARNAKAQARRAIEHCVPLAFQTDNEQDYMLTVLLRTEALLPSDSRVSSVEPSIAHTAVETLIDSGDVALAWRLAQQIRDEPARASAASRVAVAFARAGNGAAARTIDGTIKSTFSREKSAVCGAIAGWHARAGRLLRARRHAQTCSNPADAIQAYSEILHHRTSKTLPSRTTTTASRGPGDREPGPRLSAKPPRGHPSVRHASEPARGIAGVAAAA